MSSQVSWSHTHGRECFIVCWSKIISSYAGILTISLRLHLHGKRMKRGDKENQIKLKPQQQQNFQRLANNNQNVQNWRKRSRWGVFDLKCHQTKSSTLDPSFLGWCAKKSMQIGKRCHQIKQRWSRVNFFILIFISARTCALIAHW